jgi:NitT/TauT family transport system substrate-binding protein
LILFSNRYRKLLCVVLALCAPAAAAGNTESIRVGVLKFGTVNWMLDVVEHHQLAQQQSIKLEVVPLASKSATHVAIQGGAVDVIVTDWVWVSRQRAEGRPYTFAPYSTAVGGVMLRPDADIPTVGDLVGKKLGIAGGPVDKSWLLLRAYARHTLGKDLANVTETSFAAPPLLNQLARKGELQAVLNFWHYNARLKAAGFKTLITVPEILSKLDIKAPVPLVGWVFNEEWAASNAKALKGMLRAVAQAERILLESDNEWDRLKPLLKAPDRATEIALRDAFRNGVSNCFDQSVIDAAGKIYAILAEEGGKELVGDHPNISIGTFWPQLDQVPCR